MNLRNEKKVIITYYPKRKQKEERMILLSAKPSPIIRFWFKEVSRKIEWNDTFVMIHDLELLQDNKASLYYLKDL